MTTLPPFEHGHEAPLERHWSRADEAKAFVRASELPAQRLAGGGAREASEVNSMGPEFASAFTFAALRGEFWLTTIVQKAVWQQA